MENIVVRLVLATYADNDNLYVGLEKISGESPECWETYTDITVNCNPCHHSMRMWTAGTATGMCMTSLSVTGLPNLQNTNIKASGC